jgi:hypothetical protein
VDVDTDVAASTKGVLLQRKRRDPDALQLCEHPEGFGDANDDAM